MRTIFFCLSHIFIALDFYVQGKGGRRFEPVTKGYGIGRGEGALLLQYQQIFTIPITNSVACYICISDNFSSYFIFMFEETV